MYCLGKKKTFVDSCQPEKRTNCTQVSMAAKNYQSGGESLCREADKRRVFGVVSESWHFRIEREGRAF